MSELAAFTDSSLDDRMLEPVDEPAAHVPWNRVRTVMRELAGQTTRQLVASSRRNAIEWDAQSDARYVAGVLGSWSASRPAEALVSIVMPTYNRAGVIERAIESVQRQTYQNWELLVVDDGSTDGTSAVLAKLQKDEPRLTVLTTPRTGVSAARNRGLDAAIGTYLAFLDTDNAWRPHFLATSVIELERLPVAGTFSAVDVHRDDGRHEFLGCQVGRQELLDGPNQVDLNALVVRRDVVTLAGGFDETLPRWVDYDLVLRVAKDGELRYLPTVGVAYDHHSTAADRISVVESSHWREVVLEKNLLDWEELRSSTSRVAGRRSVLIRSSRQWPATLSTVRRVLSAPGDVEVVILDNGSPREDAAILTAAFVGDPRVIVRRLPWMLRLATSTNLAFAQSTGTIITVVEPGEIGDQAVFSSRDILRSQGFEIDGDDRGFAPRGLVLRGAKPIQPKED
jgi:glycosyltransferase involved in cell wall biosynthesis